MKLRDSLFILAVVLPIASHAAPVTYDFTVSATTGPRTGMTGSGYFTFDDTIVPSGGGILYATALLSDLSFNFDGLSYDENTANTGYLFFDTAGALAQATFGSHCSAGSCLVDADFVGFFVNASSQFAYSVGGGSASNNTGLGNGYATLTLRDNGVPEPATLGLAALALAAAGACSARGRKAWAQALA